MATYTAAPAAATAQAFAHGMANNVKVLCGSVELATAVAANDVIQIGKLPAGAVAFMGWMYGDDIDTGTETLDMDVGWAASADGGVAADPDGFGNFGVITGDTITDLKPVAGIWFPLQGTLLTGGPQVFSEPVTVQIDVNAAAAATGTGTLTVVVLYFIDPNFAVTDVG